MRIAAIDIGTNSVHMIVVRVRPDLSFEVIDREKAMVRLGAGGLDGQALTAEAMNAALQALSKFKRLAESHRVDEILAAATSATREARNGGEFLARIERETGIRPRVITGTEEARLIHQAAVYGVDVGSGRAVVIDVGGGSVEITLGTATAIQAGAQLQDWRDPAHRTLRPERSAVGTRRTQAHQTYPAGDRPPLRADHGDRIRSRDRHVGHDPQSGRGGRDGGARHDASRTAQPARVGETDSPAAQGQSSRSIPRSG